MRRDWAAEFEQRCDRALAIINKNPGITKDRLEIKLGITRDTLDRLLTSLFTRGEIRLGCDRFSGKCSPITRTWAIDYEPGIKDSRLFQVAKAPQPCKVYIDPSVIAAPAPARRRIDDLPTATQWRESVKSTLTPTPKPAMTQPDPIADHLSKLAFAETQQTSSAKRSRFENRDRCRTAIAQMIESGIELNRHQLCKKAGIPINYFAGNPAMKKEYDAAIAQIVSSKSATPHEPVADLPKTVREETEDSALQHQIEELEQRNRELREQIQALQSQSTDDLVIQALREDEARLKATLKRIEEEARELEQEKKSAIARLHGVQQAIALRTGDVIQPVFEMVVPANGNGKHAVVGGVA